MVIAKGPIRCKLEIDGEIVEQVMWFNYLGTKLNTTRDQLGEIEHQTIRATQIYGILRTIFTDSKVRIYKAMVRLVQKQELK